MARICETCAALMVTRTETAPPDAVVVARVSARFCGPACRQRAYLRRRGLAHGWGNASDRRVRRAKCNASSSRTDKNTYLF